MWSTATDGMFSMPSGPARGWSASMRGSVPGTVTVSVRDDSSGGHGTSTEFAVLAVDGSSRTWVGGERMATNSLTRDVHTFEVDVSASVANRADKLVLVARGTRDGRQGTIVETRASGSISVGPSLSADPQPELSQPAQDLSEWEDIDPSNYQKVVNADTPSGIALSPSEVKDGVTADPGGTEVNLSDGTTVTVFPRTDANEAIRDTETGAPIDSPVGSGGVEGGVGGGGDGGLLGAGVALVLLVVAGAAALLRGGE